MSESINYIPNRIKNAAVGGHVCGAEDVIDDTTGLTLEKVAGGALEEKEYTSSSNNGMGRVVLRKNLVGGVNTLTQAMMQATNTIYVIQYDFTLGEDITVPANCVLEFEGGSLNNSNENAYKIYGNSASFNNASYNIFNSVEFVGFTIPYIDLRWVGGVPDYNRQQNIGTDNAPYFERAVNLIGKYYEGLPINIVGAYFIASSVTTPYDLNLRGYHNCCRDQSNLGYEADVILESSITVAPSITAFNMTGHRHGEASPSSKYAFISIKNILICGSVTQSDPIRHSNFIYYTAGGAPTRVCIVEECEITDLNVFLEIIPSKDTSIGDMTISKCVVYNNNKFINANSSDSNVRTVTNFLIKDCNIEHNNSNCITLKRVFGYIGILNNILEGQDAPIYIESSVTGSKIEILNNYFEGNTGDVITITSSYIFNPLLNTVKLNNHVDCHFVGTYPSGYYVKDKIRVKLLAAKVIEADFENFSDDSSVEDCIIDCDTTHYNIEWTRYAFFSQFKTGNSFSMFDNKNEIEGYPGLKLTVPYDYNFGKKLYTIQDIDINPYRYFSMLCTSDDLIEFCLFNNGYDAKGDARTVIATHAKGYLLIVRQKVNEAGNLRLAVRMHGHSESTIYPWTGTYGFVGSVNMIEDTTISPKDIVVSTIGDITINDKNNVDFVINNRSKYIGYTMYDLTLNKLVLNDGTDWVDATGTPVS